MWSDYSMFLTPTSSRLALIRVPLQLSRAIIILNYKPNPVWLAIPTVLQVTITTAVCLQNAVCSSSPNYMTTH